MDRTDKIEATHLKRKAILYIRQSTMRQVYENTESTLRQYSLKERLKHLGWVDGMIEIIDCDLGRSGADTSGRDGFRQMMADVGEGNVGAIACIECSRLSRSSGDWERLMEICALSGTILIDDDGVYDPNNFNDRLLLGLKGTMSQAELHFLGERMRGGALSKAMRGDLKYFLPVGYIYDEAGRIVKDPDIQVQDAVSLFFETFRICGSANKLVIRYGEKGYLFPVDRNRGFGNKTDIYWDILTVSRACHVLHSPLYAGVYTYGRIQTKNTIKGKKRIFVPEKKWVSYIEDHHEAYITLEEFRMNCNILGSNQTRKGASPPREGDALIQGIVFCSKCGGKMYVQYKKVNDAVYWQYICRHFSKREIFTNKACSNINGRVVDEAIIDVMLHRLTPEAIKVAEEVQLELEKRKHNEDKYFIMQVDKARYETDLARKRYMKADPENRLVCAELERLWNEKMNQLAIAESDLRKHQHSSESGQKKTDMEKLLSIPERFQKAWHDNKTGMSDKKRIVRCLIEDITLNMIGDEILIGIRFKGGLTESIKIQRPLMKYKTWTTDPRIVDYIREASKTNTVDEIVKYLNDIGEKSGKGLPFTSTIVRNILYQYDIPSLKEHLKSIGFLSTAEKAKQLGISSNVLFKRRAAGRYTGFYVKTSGDGDYMYEP